MLREIVEAVTYDDWKIKQSEVNKLVDDADALMQKYSTSGGLVSDEIRNSKEYKRDNQTFKVAFKNLQAFNKSSPKEFQKRDSKERREIKTRR